jgi:hypothetical protein
VFSVALESRPSLMPSSPARSLPAMLNGLATLVTILLPDVQLLLNNFLSNPLHGRVLASLEAVLPDLIQDVRVDDFVDGTPHGLVHHLADDAAVEVDDLHAVLEVACVGGHNVVGGFNVSEDLVADNLAAVLGGDFEGGHRVVHLQQLLEGNLAVAEECGDESEWLGLSDVVVVDVLDDDLAGQFVHVWAKEEFADGTLCWSRAVVVLFRAHVLLRVEDAVAEAGEEGELVLVGNPADVGLAAVVADGVHVDSARTCGGSRGLGVASGDGVAVPVARHVEVFVAKVGVEDD